MRLLVVDDDPDVRDSLQRSLEFEGYEVDTAGDGAQALRLVLAASGGARPDLTILDLMMPDVDGMETCRRLREAGDRMPVLMLTARDGLGDKVMGLDAGADDYLVKPFALEELLARVRALLKLNRRPPDDRPGMAPREFEDLRLDPSSREVTRAGRPITLTPTEFDLLAVFLDAPGQVLSRARLQQAVWGHDPGTNNLDVYIGYLRRKTEAGGRPRLLHTVRGVGFTLRVTP
ncbi:two-component system response regulator [Amycolatopsis mediterranei S699]|uniref:Two-component system response regulator n=2 Tax=Amycolatopsis mediterranei TaxID=33910 RepID=A0A0H3DCQ8_AMYMU|nr:response regulator transcription factor [Amycolatopsis mediterranei]ADJ47419.1 two-component system response regulator [Amycolatopsis mediterranei U32]AEK44265.1 two-component system response regulator [Amycolatopsis mediterranei S699]AFO79130.1 two-component system response regulator [Amycolatopsis mediterranei S699]AGT86258.1 two-component system response regulator [Amycolatopsis mediterranei RB]KDO12655.1 transcriptional regulator [Amycolatopsis mediterranei]